jgi:hypothetical protein
MDPSVDVHERVVRPRPGVWDSREVRLRDAGYLAIAMIDFGTPPTRSIAIWACGK